MPHSTPLSIFRFFFSRELPLTDFHICSNHRIYNFSNGLQGAHTTQGPAVPFPHNKAKKNCFIKQLIGHYLQKEISSSMAGPDLQALNLFPSVTAAFKLGTKIQQQQQQEFLLQKDLHLPLGFQVLQSLPRRFSLTCVNSHLGTDAPPPFAC